MKKLHLKVHFVFCAFFNQLYWYAVNNIITKWQNKSGHTGMTKEWRLKTQLNLVPLKTQVLFQNCVNLWVQISTSAWIKVYEYDCIGSFLREISWHFIIIYWNFVNFYLKMCWKEAAVHSALFLPLDPIVTMVCKNNYQEFHETCHYVKFYFMKKDSKTML